MKSLKKSAAPPVVTSPDAYYKDVSVSRKFRLFERCSAMIVRVPYENWVFLYTFFLAKCDKLANIQMGLRVYCPFPN